MNYYKETILKIQEFIKNEKWNQAYKLVEEEISMPYIPKKYECVFIKLRQEIHAHLHLNTKTSQIHFDKFDIFKILESNDNPLLPQALNQLRELNLSSCINEIKLIFKNSKIKHSVKVIIFEYLVEQNIDEFLDVNTPFISLKISTKTSLILTSDYNELTTKIENIINDNPSLLEISNFYVNQFLINLFPQIYTYEDDDEEIFIDIAHVAIGKDSKTIDSSKYLFINTILKRYI